MKYFLSVLIASILLLNGRASAQSCDATPSVVLHDVGQYECITVCEGSETIVQVHREVGAFTPCDVINLGFITLYPGPACPSDNEPFGYATLDPLVWMLDDTHATFTNVIHGLVNGRLRVTFDMALSPDPIVQIDPANGFPQSMCVFVQFAPYAQPCFGPFTPDQVPVIVERPGCNVTTPCNSSDGAPPDHYSSRLDFYSGVGIYHWSAFILGDNGGNVCLTMERILPVEMLSFTAIAGDRMVALNWRTGSESNLSSFRVSRSAQGGAEMTIENVPATNNPTGANYHYNDRAVENGQRYSYRLYVTGEDGSETAIALTADATPMADVVTNYVLSSNYPNPFNPSTSIGYALKDAGRVTLTVYDLGGRVVRNLVNREQVAGSYHVTFDGAGLPSGIYYYRLNVNGFTATQKMVLIR